MMSSSRHARGHRALLAGFGLALAWLLAFGAPQVLGGNSIGPGFHWNDGSDNVPRVTMVDHTGPQWPVFAAHQEWDFAGEIDVDYRLDSCDGRPHCVGLDAYDFGVACNDGGGFARLFRNSAGNHLSDASYVRFNTRCNDHTDREQRVITCQEEGHLLGLDHDDPLFAITCMGRGPLRNSEETPRPHDFDMLDNQIYDHND